MPIGSLVGHTDPVGSNSAQQLKGHAFQGPAFLQTGTRVAPWAPKAGSKRFGYDMMTSRLFLCGKPDLDIGRIEYISPLSTPVQEFTQALVYACANTGTMT